MKVLVSLLFTLTLSSLGNTAPPASLSSRDSGAPIIPVRIREDGPPPSLPSSYRLNASIHVQSNELDKYFNLKKGTKPEKGVCTAQQIDLLGKFFVDASTLADTIVKALQNGGNDPILRENFLTWVGIKFRQTNGQWFVSFTDGINTRYTRVTSK